jgi:hypothetical protein
MSNSIAASMQQLSDVDKSYLDRYYDEVAMMAKYYFVSPILVLAIGQESTFASAGTYLRTGDAFGMTAGGTAHMTSATSPADDVAKFFAHYGNQIWVREAISTSLSTRWKVYFCARESKRPPKWPDGEYTIAPTQPSGEE